MPSIDYPQLRSCINIQRVLELLRFQPLRRQGHELRGPCPLHRSTSKRSRCFAANVVKNTYRCFHCGAAGNQLDLWAEFRQLPLYEASLDLCHRLAEDIPLLNRHRQPTNQGNIGRF